MKKLLLSLSIILLFSLSISAQDTLATFKFKVVNDSSLTFGNAYNTGNLVLRDATFHGHYFYTTGVDGTGDYCLSSTNWTLGLDSAKCYYTSFASTAYQNILFSSRQKSSNTGPKDFKVQYMVGAGGTWTDVAGATVTDTNDNYIKGTLTNIALPADCNNQASVSLRWIMATNSSVNNGTVGAGGTSRIDNIIIIGEPYLLANYTVSTSSSPSIGGSTSGGGNYSNGSSCTITATANSGYSFINWTENGSQVSSNVSYTFIVSGDKNLIANFSCNVPSAVSVSGGGTFCNSANLIASGGSGGTIYWQGTTSGGTSTAYPGNTAIPTSSGTYYFRSYNSCGWGPEGSASVTINIIPTSVSVSGGGTFCNSANLTASGGIGGTIYWQGTTNNGISTANPGNTATPTSSGTYYFRSYNSCGWGAQGSAIVTINVATASSNSPICANQTLNLYSSCVGSTYSWSGPNNFTSSIQNPVIINATPSAMGTYSLTTTLMGPDLVVNGNFSAGNSGFITSYNSPAGGPWGPLSVEGTCMISTDPLLTQSNFMSFGDHTSGTGNMLVVNGNAIANTVVWSENITVIPNTDYNFSAWVASLLTSIPIGQQTKLQFSINGNILGSIHSAPLTGGTWSNFYVTWNSGTNSSAIITIVDQSTASPGNDFALDDIIFQKANIYSDTINVTINSQITPAFTAVAAICSGDPLAALPTTSTNGITGTWSPAMNNTVTTTYTFTPTAGLCANTTTLTITVNPAITPTFTAIGPLCQYSVAPVLPLNSTNVPSITGSWNAAVITGNAGTSVYTFTPATGQCASTTTLSIMVNPQIMPTFTAIGPLCQNSVPPVLPLISTNAIPGTWNAAINTTNAGTTVYTFTPAAGQCATTATMSITVDPQITPTFPSYGPYCQNSAPPLLPLISTNVPPIPGTWNPAINTANAGTTVYTFTPAVGQCARTVTESIFIDPQIYPTFTAIAPLCQNSVAPALPLSSTNVPPINGSWYPATNTSNAGTTVYTFTPATGQCASTATLIITVDPQFTPTFAPIGPLCQNSVPPVLPTSSTNVPPYSGTWNAVISTTIPGTTVYSFTPTVGQWNCPTTASMSITINSIPVTPIISLNGLILQSDAAIGNQWYNQNGLINGETNQNCSPIIEGDYYTVVTLNGCSSNISNSIQVIFTGIELTDVNRIIKVYPNPVSDELIIEIEGNKELTNFEIYNSIGQVVLKGSVLEKTIVQTTNLTSGVYLIKQGNGKTFNLKKIVKE